MSATKLHDSGFTVSVAVARAPTPRRISPLLAPRKERVVQVRIDATIEEWHRPKLDPWHPGTHKLETACGQPFGGYYMTRDQTYRGGSLCKACFTPGEIADAEQWARDEETRLRQEAEEWEKERAESMQRALEESRQRRERFRTGETKPFSKPDPDPEDG